MLTDVMSLQLLEVENGADKTPCFSIFSIIVTMNIKQAEEDNTAA